mgnify:CR=1 FL=1
MSLQRRRGGSFGHLQVHERLGMVGVDVEDALPLPQGLDHVSPGVIGEPQFDQPRGVVGAFVDDIFEFIERLFGRSLFFMYPGQIDPNMRIVRF